jgi:glycosyltransferase involved in cell wall biosynthesis
MPSFLAFLPLPFVWGPVGGGESAPYKFRSSFSVRSRIHECLRDFARVFVRFDPVGRRMARQAVSALATTAETRDKLRALGCAHAAILSHVALPQHELDRLSMFPARKDGCFRVLSIGELLHWKGFEFGLRAFACVHSRFPENEYWIVGDGPERKRLERLTHRMGISEKVKFLGRLPRTEALQTLSSCDVLLHPSLHDSGGWVCLEAMAAGRPVICLELGGPALLVTDETGIKVRACSPMQVIRDLAAALEQFASNRALCEHRGRAAREKARQDHTWDRKGDYINKVYESAILDYRSRADEHKGAH